MLRIRSISRTFALVLFTATFARWSLPDPVERYTSKNLGPMVMRCQIITWQMPSLGVTHSLATKTCIRPLRCCQGWFTIRVNGNEPTGWAKTRGLLPCQDSVECLTDLASKELYLAYGSTRTMKIRRNSTSVISIVFQLLNFTKCENRKRTLFEIFSIFYKYLLL